jgi:hypothetical protein
LARIVQLTASSSPREKEIDMLNTRKSKAKAPARRKSEPESNFSIAIGMVGYVVLCYLVIFALITYAHGLWHIGH